MSGKKILNILLLIAAALFVVSCVLLLILGEDAHAIIKTAFVVSGNAAMGIIIARAVMWLENGQEAKN